MKNIKSHYLSRVALQFGLVFAFLGCSNSNFSSHAAKEKRKAVPKASADVKVTARTKFSMGLEGAPAAIKAENFNVLTQIIVAEGSQEIPLPDAEKAEWNVAFYLNEETTPVSKGAVGSTAIDFSKMNGVTRVRAEFEHQKTKKTGNAVSSVFVDGEKPILVFMETPAKSTNEHIEFIWSAVDNYGVDELKSGVVACRPFPGERIFTLQTLPADCILVHQLSTLTAQKETSASLDTLSIQGMSYGVRDVQFLFVGTDKVGNQRFQGIIKGSESASALVLTSPATKTGVVSKSLSVSLPISLEAYIKGEKLTGAELQASIARGDYEVILDMNGTKTTRPYASPFIVNFAADGSKDVTFSVKKKGEELASNPVTISTLVDTKAPAVSNLKIQVPNGVLSADSMPVLGWNASDANGISNLTVEMLINGSTTWEKIPGVDAGQSSASFTWGADRPTKSFKFKVTATDAVGNVTVQESPFWVPQIFNSAVLTKSVECFWCHLKVEGDVAGINFELEDKRIQDPAFPNDPSKTILVPGQKQAKVHEAAGRKLSISGNFFSTNLIPDSLVGLDKITNEKILGGQKQENYKNSGMKVFPSQLDGSGVPTFPILKDAFLSERVLGSLRLGSLFISRTYTGNLYLDGTNPSQPIQLNGEVYIDGDLIIKGKYKGRGTIYAKNVFIVDDLVATKSVFPYPFNVDDAVAKAKLDVASDADALHIGAIKNVVVGTPEAFRWDRDNNRPRDTPNNYLNPYSWFSKEQYQAAGGRPVYAKNKTTGLELLRASDGRNLKKIVNGIEMDDLSAGKHIVEVARVDAFLYAAIKLEWYAYGAFVLNGGFVAPESTIICSTCDTSNASLDIINPRNGMPAFYNTIRYDYRLRVGGEGFESLKAFFEAGAL